MRPKQRIVEKLKYSTILRILFDAVSKVGIRVTPYYLVQEGGWRNEILEFEKGFWGYEVRFLYEEDMRYLSRLPCRSISKNDLIKRLKNGHYCLALLHEGNVVAFNWVNPFECSGQLCAFPLHSDEAYLYDAYTIPSYRGKRLAPYLIYQTYKTLSNFGILKVYGIFEAFNTPAVKFKKEMDAKFIRFGVSISLFKICNVNFGLRNTPEYTLRFSSSVEETTVSHN